MKDVYYTLKHNFKVQDIKSKKQMYFFGVYIRKIYRNQIKSIFSKAELEIIYYINLTQNIKVSKIM